MLRKLLAFFWKDVTQARSYRMAFILQYVGLLVPLVMLFFLGRVLNDVTVPKLERYGGEYLPFMLVGGVLTFYSFMALQVFAGALRRAQFTGTLETLLLTRTSLPTLLVGWSLYRFLTVTVSAVAYGLGGILVLGIEFEQINWLSAFLIIILIVTIMGSLGLISASFVLVFKRGDPFTATITAASGLLSGAFYPISVLPGWLQAVSKLLPHTYALEAMRLAVLKGYPLSQLAPELSTLAMIAVGLLPLSFFILQYSMHRAKVEGSLAHY